jgi:hypothetical protein
MPAVTHLNVPWGGVTIVALLFETDRAPFVLKNPHFGSRENDPIAFEVPWREGTETRSADRSELLRILSPVAELPQFEVLWGRADGYIYAPENEGGQPPEVHLSVEAEIYVVPTGEKTVVIPKHKTAMLVRWPEIEEPLVADDVTLYLTNRRAESLVSVLSSELVVQGPGAFRFQGSLRFKPMPVPTSALIVDCLLEPVLASSVVVVEATMNPVVPFEDQPGPAYEPWGQWDLYRRDALRPRARSTQSHEPDDDDRDDLGSGR